MRVENGCTEAEAMVAAQKASDLIREYDVSFENVQAVKAERYGARERDFTRSANTHNLHQARRYR